MIPILMRKPEAMANVESHATQSITPAIFPCDDALTVISSRTLVDRIRNRSKLECSLKKSDVKMRRPGSIWRIHDYSVISSHDLGDIRYNPFYLDPCRKRVLPC